MRLWLLAFAGAAAAAARAKTEKRTEATPHPERRPDPHRLTKSELKAKRAELEIASKTERKGFKLRRAEIEMVSRTELVAFLAELEIKMPQKADKQTLRNLAVEHDVLARLAALHPEWRRGTFMPCRCSKPWEALSPRDAQCRMAPWTCPQDPLPGDDVEVVVSHCRYDMLRERGLPSLVQAIVSQGLRLARVTVVAKCGLNTTALHRLRARAVEDPTHPLFSTSVQLNVVPADNVGRCDHTWAAHIATNYDSLASRLIMIKDSWGHHVLPELKSRNANELVRAPHRDPGTCEVVGCAPASTRSRPPV